MNTKVIIVVLAVAVVGLGITLYVIKSQDDQRHANDVTQNQDLSNQVCTVNANLDAEKQVNLALTNDLLTARQQGADLSNSLAATQDKLAQQTHATEMSQASLTAAQDKISGLNQRVSQLEADNTALDRHAAELTNAIAQLNSQITDLQTQLGTTRTDKAYLEKQLAQLRTEKADLEHKFNDLETVRQQYRKLKTEAFITNRIQLDRATATTAGKKGGEILIAPRTAPTAAPAAATKAGHYDLNVEVGSDGSVRAIPPLTTTNSAAH